jgi:hypothetical protein
MVFTGVPGVILSLDLGIVLSWAKAVPDKNKVTNVKIFLADIG